MSDELRQAAERLRRIRNGEPGHVVYGPDDACWAQSEADDESEVISAYLFAQNMPPEDDEPIDEAFLRSIGWDYHSALMQWASSWIGNIRIVYWPRYKQSEWWIDVRDPTFPPAIHRNAVMAEISSIKTRGDVRRLLAALGVGTE